MDYEEIRRRLAHCRFTQHAQREMETEPLGRINVEEILQALDLGEIIEEYSEDKPYSSCLIFGRTAAARPLDVVCAPVPSEEQLIIITTYQPDPERWEPDFRRRNH